MCCGITSECPELTESKQFLNQGNKKSSSAAIMVPMASNQFASNSLVNSPLHWILKYGKFKRHFLAVCWVGSGRASANLGKEQTCASALGSNCWRSSRVSQAPIRAPRADLRTTVIGRTRPVAAFNSQCPSCAQCAHSQTHAAVVARYCERRRSLDAGFPRRRAPLRRWHHRVPGASSILGGARTRAWR